ncbi:SDR family oxidoreductase [Streptomyces sp. NPDC059477]|uniref:SDR family oxidoreductase n=1 Tax=Streptomyces sp. NPDC059477 TaxID=3346847 RepID=UPI00369B7621
MTEMDLRGTVSLVTGASSGIGAAVARTLAARGSAVALLARREDRLASLALELREAGARALPVPADVTDPERAAEAVRRTVAGLGRLDILVNNAGAARPGPMLHGSVDAWDEMVRVNLLGSLYLTHAALPHLIDAAEQGPRRIADLVGISSVSGRAVHAGNGVYAATKQALNTYSESLRKEVAGRRVRVAVVEPASVATDLLPARVRGTQEAARTFERLSPADVADAVAYVVTRPAHAAVSQLLIRPSESER